MLTPQGWIPIQDLALGDAVFAVDVSTGKRVETTVVDIRSANREVGGLSVEGANLRLTSDHPVYCPIEGQYFPAGDWLIGKRTTLAALDSEGLHSVGVLQANVFVELTTVFDISVDSEHHNFVVEGILVHNKEPLNNPYHNSSHQDASNTNDSKDMSTPDGGPDAGVEMGTGLDAGARDLDAGTRDMDLDADWGLNDMESTSSDMATD